MAIYQLIACTIIANDILKGFGVFRNRSVPDRDTAMRDAVRETEKMLSHSQVWRSDALH